MIADCGLSKSLINQTSGSVIREIHGYIEPQCYKNPGYKRNKKSDIYSLGVLFWEISSGRIPFLNNEPHNIWFKICNGLRETPADDTPSKYQQLYQKCWDTDPDSRPDINNVRETLIQLKSRFDTVECEIQEGNNQYV